VPTYRSILQKAFEITLRFKWLWILGFFAALLGNGGEYEIFFKNFINLDSLTLSISLITSSSLVAHFFVSLGRLISSENPLINYGFLLVLGIFVYLSITSQGALMSAVYNHATKKHKISIKESFTKTNKNFFELLFTHIIFKGGGLIAILLFAIPFIVIFKTIFSLSFVASAVIIAFMIVTPLAIIISFLVKYSILFVIVKNKHPMDAFMSGLKVFKKNWLITLEVAAILFAINIISGLLTVIVVLIISFPFIAVLAAKAHPYAFPVGNYVTIIAWIGIIVAPIVGSVLATFQNASWAILFSKLNARKPMYSKLVRVTADVLRRI
jgi:hypothetical protein